METPDLGPCHARTFGNSGERSHLFQQMDLRGQPLTTERPNANYQRSCLPQTVWGAPPAAEASLSGKPHSPRRVWGDCRPDLRYGPDLEYTAPSGPPGSSEGVCSSGARVLSPLSPLRSSEAAGEQEALGALPGPGSIQRTLHPHLPEDLRGGREGGRVRVETGWGPSLAVGRWPGVTASMPVLTPRGAAR